MKKRKSTKSRVSDILVTLFCLGGTVACLYLFWQDFNMVMSRLESPVATVTWKRKAAQRKFSDRLIWDRLQQNAEIYNGDTIRTAADAETTITMKDSVIELGGSTIIQVTVDDEGTTVDFSGGVVSAMVGGVDGGSGLRLKSGDVTVDLEQGSTLAATAASGTSGSMLQLQVTEGNATISDTTGTHELRQGEAVSMDENGQMQAKMITVTEPQPQARILNFNTGSLPVKFSWSTQNLPSGSTVIFETAADKQFTDIREQIAISGLRNMTMNMENGVHYWRLYATENGEMVPHSMTEGRLNILAAPTPTAIVPEEGDQFHYRTRFPSLRFMWNGNEYASRYLFEIANNPEMRNPVVSQNSVYPSSIVSNLGEGTWYWRVTPYYTIGNTGYAQPSKVSSFRIDRQAELEAPVPIAPANGGLVNIAANSAEETQSAPVFSWQRGNDAQSYTLQLAQDEAMRRQVEVRTTTDNYVQLMPPSTGRWYWTVTQTDTEGNKSPASPVQSFMAIDREIVFQPVFPPEGYSIAQARLEDTRFTWKSNVPDNIIFQIASDKDFKVVKYEETLSRDTLGTFGRPLEVGTYYWRLLCGTGKDRITTETRQLDVVPPLDKPVLKTPPALSRVIVRPAQKVTFSWEPVEEAHYYQVQLYINDGTKKEEQEAVFQELYAEQTEVTSTFDNLPDGSYRWTVQAFADETPISSRRTGLLEESYFTVMKIFPVELTSPASGTQFEGLQAFFEPSQVAFSSRSSIIRAEIVISRDSRHALPPAFGQEARNKGAIVHRAAVNGNTAKLPPLGAGTYWYTINAQTIGGLDISSTVPRVFTVLPIEPFAATRQTEPTNGTVFDETYLVDKLTADLAWSTIEGAEAYLLTVSNAETNQTIASKMIAAPSNGEKTIRETLDLAQLGVGSYRWTVAAKRFMPGKENLPLEQREILQDGRDATATFTISLPEEEIYVYNPGDLYGN